VGADLFINARCDVYLRGIESGDAAVSEIGRRAARYRNAGCDGLFAPCLVDAADIEAVATAVAPLPLNVMLMPDLPALDKLPVLGVRRLSAGSAIAEAALGYAKGLAEALLAGKPDDMYAIALDYGTANELFTDR
jgi:2-methylisocitrate lyase-like PEP mutase family enzyme